MNYRDKYLKYKNKYLKLKTQYGGDIEYNIEYIDSGAESNVFRIIDQDDKVIKILKRPNTNLPLREIEISKKLSNCLGWWIRNFIA